MGLRPTHRDENRWVFDGAVIAPGSLRRLGLSLAFQAQFLALAQPRDERIGAANASECPWACDPPIGMKTGGFSTERNSRSALRLFPTP